MRTLYRLKHWMILPTGVITAVLGTTIALGWLAFPDHTVPVAAATPYSSTTQRSVDSVAVFSLTAVPQNMTQSPDNYEPPDNGGPSTTGGSGTRCYIKSV
ncbi:hypothetical protein H6F86_11745 [Phormidium sp. FACHB-592]|uniref:Uncharacterized protein n=1 Tax=Stenomitos frigidus AS-A4 TaxID=2933935 RepID=A0ABV0KM14_9CYAN|nr:hypothetical protein [Phormidium sp. FACHB-592]MBD2074546.1 hypothetical protein [Phormidium sp. FACHB-592]